ncbi:NAD(P)H-hydrate dehydratase [Boseongicola sp. H5]|uniref:NAD(P)H-hydrate dehydratase n=1 Tax=Boseongicola sp. H5 TaxID=2763261 RepID=UPI001D0A1D51
MTELLTAAQMRGVETAAIDSGSVTGLELMERAGRGVVEAVFAEWPDLAQAPHRAVVLCGPGNNGGDGFVVARLLKGFGWEVEVFLYGDPDHLPPDARANYERWRELGAVTMRGIDPPPLQDDSLVVPECSLIVDGLFGTGLTRPFRGLFTVFAQARDVFGKKGVRVVAIDTPSGLCADSGRILGTAIRADLSVTFHAAKLGHYLDRGPSECGKTVLCDIGLTPRSGGSAVVPPVETVRLVERPAHGALAKRADHHKYSHGHALILSGGSGAGGAARLAARGALRIGAGLVSVVCEDAAVAEHAAQLTAIMIKRANGAGGLATLLEDERLNALCLGPGLGVDRARDLVPVALGAGDRASRGRAPGAPPPRRSVVLDADALTAFADAPADLFAMLHESCILTPHAGEFSRLFPDLSERLDAAPTKGPAYSKVDATREAAARAGCVVLFKGPDTVTAEPSGRASINAARYDRAAPWLATAGSGDVLAGFITGLLARGMSPMEAAETGAWLHVDCARAFGPGLVAEDLPERLPEVLRDLEDAAPLGSL